MSRLITFVFGAAAGAAAAHFLDPDKGSERRSRALDAAGKAKSAVPSPSSLTSSSAAEQSAATQTGPGLDDVSLARKVETEIFRDPAAPKGEVSVDVQAAVVHLRGAVADPEWIARLADEAGKVEGVKGVKNLLHRPGTPAPAPESSAAG